MMTLEDCRRFYADEIRFSANLRSSALVEAFARVPRERYLGPPPWQIGSPEQRALSAAAMVSMAYFTSEDPRDVYHNVVIALDPAKDLNNGQPGALARWIDALNLKAGDRVYHLGCGVGYYTAIMAEVVGAGGTVVGSEVHAGLVARARENLSAYSNVTIHAGDGAAFDPGECDAMLINAGVTHPHPPWLERLCEGGRMVAPITMATGPALGQGIMVKITRERGGFSAAIVSPVAIFSCTSVRDAQLEPLIARAFANRTLLKLKSVRLDPHEPTDTCILHGARVCVSSAEPTSNPPALASCG
jgi:protein-L-isoaspartate(D-aspartate) O-methyltransferase